MSWARPGVPCGAQWAVCDVPGAPGRALRGARGRRTLKPREVLRSRAQLAIQCELYIPLSQVRKWIGKWISKHASQYVRKEVKDEESKEGGKAGGMENCATENNCIS